MHDYFDILGVSRDARASDIRRACGRHSRPAHPDIRDGDHPNHTLVSRTMYGADPSQAAPPDAAIDFVDAAALVDRMREAFFTDPADSACASTSTR